MELNEVKIIIDTCYKAGNTRDEAIAILGTLPVNGERVDAYEYCDLKYQAIPEILSTNFTDAENAEYFTSTFNDKLRYDHRRGRWLEWGGHYWRTDNDGQITRLALRAVRTRYHNTTAIENLDKREKAAGKAITSEQRARLSAMVGIAQDLKPIADSGEHWDENPMLFATANTVIDLKTNQPIPGNQADMITMISPIKYDPEAKAPRWEKFQDEIHNGNKELIRWKQKYLGHCLTGLTTEQIIPIDHGMGANGKTVELNTIEYIMGDYGYNAPFTMFELNNRSAIPNDLAALCNKRFVTARETTEGSRFNEGRIKALTGGDPITARFLNCEFFTFKPVAKYMLAVNSLPKVQDQSYGFWRRVRMIPYNQRFEGKSDDKNLTETLKAEASGILNWLLEGCKLWQKEGLEPTPECITIATQEYEADSDPVAEFISSELIDRVGTRSAAGEIYKIYREWCHNQGMNEKDKDEVLTLTAFGKKMSQKYKKIKVGGIKYYFDVIARAGQFQDSFEANDTENNVKPNILYAREFDLEKCPKLSYCPDNTLPDCPKCGANEWTYSQDGKEIICSCGYRMAAPE